MGRFSSQTITKNDEDETDSAKTEDTSKPQEENELGGKSSKIFPNLTQCELEFIFIAATAAPSTGKKYSKTKSWKNSKYIKEQKEGATTTEKEDSAKVYSTREFRRSNSGQKRTSPSNKADSNATSEQETAHQEPKRSGKSYASKRKERQQQKKEASKANSEDGILDLPSE